MMSGQRFGGLQNAMPGPWSWNCQQQQPKNAGLSSSDKLKRDNRASDGMQVILQAALRAVGASCKPEFLSIMDQPASQPAS